MTTSHCYSYTFVFLPNESMMIVQRFIDAITYRHRRTSADIQDIISSKSTQQQETSINIHHSLQNAELIPSYRASIIRRHKLSFGMRESPNIWRERPIDTTDQFNKIFTSTWIDNNRLIFGTKDNKLMLLYCDEKRNKLDLTEIPLFKDSDDESNDVSNCGMHDIGVNQSRNLIATGGYKTNEINLFSYEHQFDSTDIQPLRVLKHHDDWIFGIAWFDNDTLISGGRDGKMNIWKPAKYTTLPQHTHLMQNNEGIRGLKANRCHNNVVVLTVNGAVKVWDAHKSKIEWSTNLKYSKEAVCLDLDEERGQIFVGSQNKITAMDPRENNKTFRYIESVDEGWGVRTVSIQNDLITIGGGLGKISFYDVRSSKYLKYASKQCIDVNSGWMREDDIYTDVFMEHMLPTPSAVYTHAYSPNFNKLFVGGGPTPYGLFGSFASVLS